MEEDHVKKPCELLLIGGSAGSLEVLFKLLPRLRPHLGFAMVVILHRRPYGDSSLAELLSSKISAETSEVEDKDEIVPGHLYLAPADYHLLIEKNRIFSLDYSEKVFFSRPSIDVTFQSAAESFGPAATAILLSGANEDGTNGLRAIRNAGGQTVAQDPASAQMPFMPHHAILSGVADLILNLDEMVTFINQLA